MDLQTLTTSQANPYRVRDGLMQRFDAVDVEEASLDGWFEMRCIRDERLRMIIRFVYAPPGCTYLILPVRA